MWKARSCAEISIAPAQAHARGSGTPPGCCRCCRHPPFQRGACQHRTPAGPAHTKSRAQQAGAGEAGPNLNHSFALGIALECADREEGEPALPAGPPQGTACSNHVSSIWSTGPAMCRSVPVHRGEGGLQSPRDHYQRNKILRRAATSSQMSPRISIVRGAEACVELS